MNSNRAENIVLPPRRVRCFYNKDDLMSRREAQEKMEFLLETWRERGNGWRVEESKEHKGVFHVYNADSDFPFAVVYCLPSKYEVN